MNTGLQYIIAGLACLGIFYLPTIFALRKLTYQFAGLILTSINKDKLRFAVNLDVTNPTGTTIRLQELDLHLFFNEYHVTTSNLGFYYMINAESTSTVSIEFEVVYDEAIAAVWNSILDGRLLDQFTVTALGTVKANNKRVNIPAITFSKEQIYNFIQ